MDYLAVKELLNEFDQDNLPGEKVQFEMMPSIRPRISWTDILDKNPTPASVLLLVYPDRENRSKFALIQRVSYQGAHSNQVSLPGGKLEEGESDLEAALREANEEIGVDPSKINVLGELTKVWVSPSGFLVTPFLAYTDETPNLERDPHEVEYIIEAGVDELLDDNNSKEVVVSSSYVKNLKVRAFEIQDKIVWGATAMILNEFKSLIS